MGEDTDLPGDAEKVLLQYVDLHGVPRGTYVPAERWARAREHGAGFAALIMAVQERWGERSVLGDVPVGPADEGVQAVPDPDSLAPTPWTDRPTAAVQCSLRQGGEPFALCSRTALADAVDRLGALGYDVRAGFELEFTAVERDGPAAEGDDPDAGAVAGAAANGARPYDVRPLEAADGFVSDLFDALAAACAGAEAVHAEAAPGQLEAALAPAGPVAAADDVVLARGAARGVGRAHGHDVTFMPFPTPEYEGNGLHCHLSLAEDGADALADPDDDAGLSATARAFVAGVLDHADALAAVCAPTVNSYKRFQPGTFAPVDRSWGVDNRTALVRVPPARDVRRLEVRLPDAYANPYLALAAVLAAGADGVREGRSPPAPGDRDRYAGGDGEPLPTSLGAALDALAADDVLVEALGGELVEGFCALKRYEVARFHGAVTDWETREYVDRL